jgi:ABC-type glycerol-3-phosphate transport system substrate-binding protein
MKRIALLIALMMVLSSTDGCSQQAADDAVPNPGEAAATDVYGLSRDVEGEVTIMMWSGDGSFLRDLGHSEIPAEELLGQNTAAAYAVAHAFNEIYPNVKINIYAKTGDPNSDGMSWAQHRENFANDYGVQPDMYAATDVPGDIEAGRIADLSIYKDDAMYQSFNPSVMKMMEYNGRQFALPQYMIPWGVFVNKSLAEANNIDVPSPDWTIEEYTAFTANSVVDDWYGAMDPSVEILRTGTKDFVYQLLYRGENDPYVNFNSEAVRQIIEFVPTWANNAIWPQRDLGLVSEEFMVAGDWWSFNYFKNGDLLTLSGDPWMMGDLAHTDPAHWGRAQFDSWDIYPRPSTDYVGNHIGVVLDPFVIRNYAMDDGNPALSDAEKAKLDVAWEFAKFWCGDTRSMQARADQQFNDNGTLKTSLNDSFPLVTGAEFDAQMEIWYGTTTHARFADANLMPGFQRILELWEDGQFWDVSDKAYPWTYEFEGSMRAITYEWDNFYNAEIVGATRTDANWLDQMYSHLPDWNEQFNNRWADKFVSVNNGLLEYYGD